MPSDEIRVKVWVTSTGKVGGAGVSGTMRVVIGDEQSNAVDFEGQGEFDITGAMSSSPSSRDTPEWVRDLAF